MSEIVTCLRCGRDLATGLYETRATGSLVVTLCTYCAAACDRAEEGARETALGLFLADALAAGEERARRAPTEGT